MLLHIKQMKIGTYAILALLIIALATVLRIFLIAWGWPHSNADEGIMGIMAMHILHTGEHPIFFYGQSYMGTLEAYLEICPVSPLWHLGIFITTWPCTALCPLSCQYVSADEFALSKKLALITPDSVEPWVSHHAGYRACCSGWLPRIAFLRLTFLAACLLACNFL